MVKMVYHIYISPSSLEEDATQRTPLWAAFHLYILSLLPWLAAVSVAYIAPFNNCTHLAPRDHPMVI